MLSPSLELKAALPFNAIPKLAIVGLGFNRRLQE